jgi:tetratricopeptide (TPR) repeat protein
MKLFRLGLFALLLLCNFAPANAQFRPDYIRPEVIDPAWFAGLVAPSTNRPIQPTFNNCPPGEYCASDNFKWPVSMETDLLGAQLSKLDTKEIDRIRKNSSKNMFAQNGRIHIASRFLRAGRFDLFFPEINDQISKWYSSEEALLMRADTLALLGRHDLALADVNAAIFWATKRKHDWALGFMYATKAEALMRLGNKTEATQAIRMANNLRDPSKFTQYYRIDWANEMAFPVLFGVSFKDVKDALIKPSDSKCTPIPPPLIIAQKAQYRNFASIRQTLPIHAACQDWALVTSEAQWVIEYAERPSTEPGVWEFRPAVLDMKVKAHKQLGQYREAEQTLLNEIERLGTFQYAKAKPYESALAKTILEEKAAGGKPDDTIVAKLKTRILQRQADDQREAALDAASGKVTMCNMTAHPVRMVLNYVEYKVTYNYVTRGWIDISSGTCLDYRVEGGTYFYYHAVDSVSYGIWSGSDKICVRTTLGNWQGKSNEPCTFNAELRPAKGVLAPTGVPQRVELE